MLLVVVVLSDFIAYYQFIEFILLMYTNLYVNQNAVWA